jgi:ribosomal-protein-alanine N-acetyltransferase
MSTLPYFFKELETERLLLRRLNENDADGIFSLRSNPEVNRYLDRDPHEKKEQAYSFIEMINSNIDNESAYYWAITLKKTAEFAGTICVWNLSDDRSKAEIGYELLPSFQGMGIMKEALDAVLKFVFSELKMSSIEAQTHPDNLASGKLLSHFNFILEEHTVATLTYRKTT